jgi:hypothetical protein
MEKNLIYIDSDGIEWKFGSIPSSSSTQNKTHVPLPIQIQGMYPETQDITLYCCCCQCQKETPMGLVVLEFDEDALHWGIRIGCFACFTTKPKAVCPHLIVELESLVTFDVVDWNKCQVCERRRCKQKECKEILDKGILYGTPVEQLLSYFYQIKLDVLSMIWHDDNKCSVCGNGNVIRKCQMCRLRVYCGKKCKKMDKEHPCEPYENVWIF